MSAGGFYTLSDFLNGCRIGIAEAFVLKGAMDTAKSDFNLNTMDQVLNFIGNGGLEKPVFINTKDWENNPSKLQPIKVDAYHFSAGSIYGYIAFMKALTGKWNIKSFKKEVGGDPRHLPFVDVLKGFQVIIEQKGKL